MKKFSILLLCLLVGITLFPSFASATDGQYPSGTVSMRDVLNNEIANLNEQLRIAEEKVTETYDTLMRINSGGNHLFPLSQYESDYQRACENRESIMNELAEAETALEELNRITGYKGDTTANNAGSNNESIKVFVNGNEVKFDVEPFIEGGRTLVPIGAIGKALGATVQWVAETKAIVLTKENKYIQMTVDVNVAIVDGMATPMDVVPQIVNGRTFVPLSFVATSLNTQVNWNQNTREVTIQPK